MDALSIFIIVVSVVLAVVFKLVLYKRIQRWMDQDLIKGLADGNPDKLAYLTERYQELQDNKVKRKHYHEQLSDFAEQFEQTR